jgi:hypothetical protein
MVINVAHFCTTAGGLKIARTLEDTEQTSSARNSIYRFLEKSIVYIDNIFVGICDYKL